MPGLPGMGGKGGMGGMGGMGGPKRAKGKQPVKKAKGKRVSGNPAKRAADQKAATRKPAAAANPFGVPAGSEEEFDPASLQLPGDLSKYLNK